MTVCLKNMPLHRERISEEHVLRYAVRILRMVFSEGGLPVAFTMEAGAGFRGTAHLFMSE